MLISVAILNYNTPQLTIDCIKSLQKLKLPKNTKLQYLLIDNHSHDDSVSQFQVNFKKELKDQTLILQINDTNLGFSGGNNQAAQIATQNNADYLLLINSDTYVDTHLLTDLLDIFLKHPQAGIVTPKIYFAPGHEFYQNRYTKDQQGKVIWFAGGHLDWDNVLGSNVGVDQVDLGQFDQPQTLELTTGCCMLIRPEIFTHQLYDDRYFLYYEDADLCQRARAQGYQIWYAPRAKMWHINAGSSGSGSNLHDYFITRNRLLFGFTYAPLRTKFALFRESLRIIASGRAWQRRGVIDYYLGNFNRGSYPVK